ncbi:hypothetical protein MHYP_G00146840 [Metynnis hypsauchen]
MLNVFVDKVLGWRATGPGSISAGAPDVSITSADRLIRQDWLPPPRVRKLTGLHQVPNVWGRLMKSHGGGSRGAGVGEEGPIRSDRTRGCHMQ